MVREFWFPAVSGLLAAYIFLTTAAGFASGISPRLGED